jgi:hypothetical protein
MGRLFAIGLLEISLRCIWGDFKEVIIFSGNDEFCERGEKMEMLTFREPWCRGGMKRDAVKGVSNVFEQLQQK